MAKKDRIFSTIKNKYISLINSLIDNVGGRLASQLKSVIGDETSSVWQYKSNDPTSTNPPMLVALLEAVAQGIVNNIYTQDTEPLDAQENDVWIDTANDVIKYYKNVNGTLTWQVISGGSASGDFVDLTTDQSIDGIKTFIQFPKKYWDGVSDYPQPTESMQFATKLYVDKLRLYNYIVGPGAGADFDTLDDPNLKNIIANGNVNIFVRNATYTITSSIFVGDNVRIIGQDKFNTQIVDNIGIKIFTNDTNRSNIEISNMTINQTVSTTNYAIYFTNITHLKLKNLHIPNANNYKIFISDIDDFELSGLYNTNSGNGVGVAYLRYINNGIIKNNVILGDTSVGILNLASSNIYIIQNNVSLSRANAWLLYIYGAKKVWVLDNNLESTYSSPTGVGLYLRANGGYSSQPLLAAINNSFFANNSFENLSTGIHINFDNSTSTEQAHYNNISNNRFNCANYTINTNNSVKFTKNQIINNIFVGSATLGSNVSTTDNKIDNYTVS